MLFSLTTGKQRVVQENFSRKITFDLCCTRIISPARESEVDLAYAQLRIFDRWLLNLPDPEKQPWID